MEKYILLYGDKKPEDNICIKNMYKNNKKINLGWTEFDYNNNIKIIDEEINKGTKQIIFAGFEIGWDRLVEYIKEKFKDIKVKVICNTQDSLLYYDYERTNFFRMLELSKEKKIDYIGFFRKGQYETYKSIGYECMFLKENYILEDKYKNNINNNENEKINLGIYPLNYTWDKNIFNQLCIPKFIDNCVLKYNCLDERMKDFLDTMKIESKAERIENIEETEIIKKIKENDVIVSTSFTEYMHPIFWISMELGIPCLTGNNVDFLNETDELSKYVITKAEDDPIINSKIVMNLIKEKSKVIKIYEKWKKEYNNTCKTNFEEFIKK